MLKFNPDFAEAVKFISLTFPYYINRSVSGSVSPSLALFSLSCSSALSELLEQHESPGHLPVSPQSLALF